MKLLNNNPIVSGKVVNKTKRSGKASSLPPPEINEPSKDKGQFSAIQNIPSTPFTENQINREGFLYNQQYFIKKPSETYNFKELNQNYPSDNHSVNSIESIEFVKNQETKSKNNITSERKLRHSYN